MIQDIYPRQFYNTFKKCTPSDGDTVFVFDDEGRIMARITDGDVTFPRVADTVDTEAVYLFAIDENDYFLSRSGLGSGITGYEPFTIRTLRDKCSGPELFAAFTAYHLWKWYSDNRYCGSCGSLMNHSDNERALVCAGCGSIVYPRINPAVIVGVIKGDELLITRYNRGYKHNALIAGFCEIGETLEQTVSREVMEEVGLHVKNIRYYKSQPWGMAQDLLAGFFCEADKDEDIRMDTAELGYAAFVKREDIQLQPNDISLTNEMMKVFKENTFEAMG